MNSIQKRFLLFLGVCFILRLLLVIIAKKINIEYLPYLGYFTLIPAFGFLYIYLNDIRKTGGEVFGENIWWNDLRPIHAVLYILFALYAIKKNKNSYIVLLVDVLFGLSAFLLYHYKNMNN